MLILGGEGVVSSVEGTLRWEEVSICPFCDCRTEDWQFEPLQIVEQPRARCSPAWITTHWSPVRSWRRPCKRPRSRAWSWCRWGPDRPAQWYGVRVTHRLPPVAIPPTRLSLDRGPTPQCAPDHLWDGFTHSQLTYRRQDLGAADFNHTYEYFGGVETAVRLLVISQRVYRLFGEVGVKRRNGYPVEVVD